VPNDPESRPLLVPVMLALSDLAVLYGPKRACVIMFNPNDLPERHSLVSDASASDLVPLLKAVVARLESGALRMPLNGEVRWVDVEEG
jgi:hypothetical protein